MAKNRLGENPFNKQTTKNSLFKSTEVQPGEVSEPKKEGKRIPKTFTLPTQLFEDLQKYVYMDRDIKSNTALVVKGLESIIYSEKGKTLLKEYDELKGS